MSDSHPLTAEPIDPDFTEAGENPETPKGKNIALRLLGRVANFLRNKVFVAIVIAVVAVSWVTSGVIARQGQPPELEKPPVDLSETDATEIEVRVQGFSAEVHSPVLLASGITQADRDLKVRSEVAGAVQQLLANEGTLIDEGAALLRLTAQDRPATLADARARLEQAQSDWLATERLHKEGFRSDTQLNAARSSLKAAEAELERAQLNVRRLVIDAPFGGFLESYSVEQGDYISTGSEVVRLLDLDPLLLTFSINEDDLSKVSLGSKVTATLSSGDELAGEITFISRSADPQTRTFRVETEIANPESRYPAGVTAQIKVALPQERLHFISPRVFVLNDAGDVGAFAVGNDNTSVFYPLEIADHQADGAWVKGLPDEVTLIVVGQSWISEGVKVRPVSVQEVKDTSADLTDGG